MKLRHTKTQKLPPMLPAGMLVGMLLCLFNMGQGLAADNYPLKNWWDSYALHEVVDTVQISSLEFGWYFDLKEIERPSNQNLRAYTCVSSEGGELKDMYAQAIRKFKSFYPDENLPYTQAHKELNRIADSRDYTVCSISESVKGHQVEKVYFLSKDARQGDLVLRVEHENLFN